MSLSDPRPEMPSWLWVAFSIGVVLLLILDIGVFHRSSAKKSVHHAVLESFFWVVISLLFNCWFGFHFGKELGLQFLTGYLVEKSLSVDNLFVILLIFNALKIPRPYQHRVLFYGILGAVLLRGGLILIGVELIQRFHWALYVFGVLLAAMALKILFGGESKRGIHETWSFRLGRKIFPLSATVHGNKFFVIEDGLRKGTPLFMALVVIEGADLIFALDSIPAVLAITQVAFVAFASNILALLGLRALYFVIAEWISHLRFLKPGLGFILGFISAKMLLTEVVQVSALISLLVVVGILTCAVVLSYILPAPAEKGPRP